MKKIILLTIASIAIFLVACNTQIRSDNPLSQLELSTIDKLIVRTQLTDNYPQEKVLLNKDDINKVLTVLKKIDINKTATHNDDNGWQFWILTDNLNIFLVGDKMIINQETYKLEEDIVDELIIVYDNLEATSRKYP